MQNAALVIVHCNHFDNFEMSVFRFVGSEYKEQQSGTVVSIQLGKIRKPHTCKLCSRKSGDIIFNTKKDK